VKERVLQILRDLRAYAVSRNIEATFFYHEEESYLMRFANSAVSLNTNEHLYRLEITAYQDRKRASYEMICDPGNLEEMKQGVDLAAQMVGHVQALNYQPTVPLYAETFIDESAFDPALAGMGNEERLAFFNQAVAGLETEEIKLSGIFSSGVNTTAQINTRSEHLQYFKSSDAQVSVVLSHGTLNWELIAEQSAQQKTELNPSALRGELAFLLEHYRHDTPRQLPLGSYDIVFGAAATASLLDMVEYLGFSGGTMKRGFSFLSEEQVGHKVFSDKFNLTDDPGRPETFPLRRDVMGLVREPFPVFEDGVFRAFTWSQDDADEFGQAPTGHSVMHKSLVLAGGEGEAGTLAELVGQPRENDLLYIPFLHYMNIVNPSKGLITASSRFGALLLKKDGTVAVPYNVRLTQSLPEIFGDRLAWLSRAQVVYNTSQSYGARNPTALVVPALLQVNGLEISHSNASY
jgi:predicted Zn-dependent protease